MKISRNTKTNGAALKIKTLTGGALFGVLAAAIAVTLCAAPASTQESNVTLIKNATILTITHGIIEHGSILVRDGKIAEVGANVAAPAGAAVIDATGEFVMPGIVDCHSHIAVEGSVNEGSVSVSSMANIADVLNPADPRYLSRPFWRRHRGKCFARQREFHWRPNRSDQAAVGPARG